MKRIAAFLLMLPLAACFEPGEGTYTVSDYLADDALRAEQLAKCRENPGQLAATPNCENATEADGKARLQRMNKALGG
ncbi:MULTISPECIES: EexN family lipoprotein [unclassified Xanthobacter]|jgi:hypothetical protein|uniref:EexN family lipoprotein n=1 Tax=Xanthobacter autotrophicus (strain ATCC BAA-1158 / Py2) TaxID=78245 RepID=A7IQI6_XANP2|nr:conserved hypothetical protein [Xanthobacter autotrophicus Py2]OYX88979.1 MAG: hypothetical protein B7Y71_00030 [Xanthobacter sp. 35-67-6]OYZ96139.1 MAG: hypothetical protein B7Y01_00050 [Xanthobacter sp. 17-67-6]